MNNLMNGAKGEIMKQIKKKVVKMGILTLIPFLFIMLAFQFFFQAVLCGILKIGCEKGEKDEKDIQAISETEIETLAALLKDRRFKANEQMADKGGIVGKNFSKLTNASSNNGVLGLTLTGPFIEQVKQVVHVVESGGRSDYSSINQSDVGGKVKAMTIGKYQMTGSNGAEVLVLTRSKNPTFFDSHIPPSSSLGKALQGSLSWDTWVNRRLADNEVAGVNAVLISEWGMEAQEEHMNKKVSGYINHVKKQGVTDSKALCYLTDTVHQKGGGGFNKYFSAYIGSGVGLTIDGAHTGALKDEALATYKTRRETVYSMCSSITANVDDVYEDGTEPVDPNSKEPTPLHSGDNAKAEILPLTEKEKEELGKVNADLKFANGVFPFESNTYEKLGEDTNNVIENAINAVKGGYIIKSPNGTKIKSSLDGKIHKYGWDDDLGYYVIVQLDDEKKYIQYSHLLSLEKDISEGKVVKKGDFIGYVGDTGGGKTGTRGLIEPRLRIALYENCLKPECYVVETDTYVAYWEKRSKVEAGENLGKGITQSMVQGAATVEADEAETYIQALIQIDTNILNSLELKKKDFEEGGKHETGIIADMWKLANSKKIKKTNGFNEDWSIDDKIMNARMTVYHCFFVGKDKVSGFLFFDKEYDSCEEIDDILGVDNYIEEEYRGVITKEIQTTYNEYYCEKIEEPVVEESVDSKPDSETINRNNGGNVREVAKNNSLTTVTANDSYYIEKIVIEGEKPSCGQGYEMKTEKTVKSAMKHIEIYEMIILFEKLSLLQEEFIDKEVVYNKDGEKEEKIDEDDKFVPWVNYYVSTVLETNDTASSAEGNVILNNVAMGGAVSGQIELENALSIPLIGKYNISRGYTGGHHYGIDYAVGGEVGRGLPVVAAMDGVVVFAGPIKSYGTLVSVQHKDKNNKNFYTKYAHVLQNNPDCPTCKDGYKYNKTHPKTLAHYYDDTLYIQVKSGQEVKRGQTLAYVGSAGQSTGYHLHFELFIPADGNYSWYNQAYIVDPKPYLTVE